MKVAVEITEVATGERRLYFDAWEYDPDDFPPFVWREGNYSCDCNRALFFGAAKNAGKLVPVADPVCGEEAYRVVVRADTGVAWIEERGSGGAARPEA